MIITTFQRTMLFILRVAAGWLLFYAGITKVLDPNWSAAGYLSTAKTFPGFYAFLASPEILPITNLLNAWGLTILGALLILGILVRFAAPLAALMMLLYYFVILDFPHPNAHSYIVDEHIIYAFVFLVLYAFYDNLALSGSRRQ